MPVTYAQFTRQWRLIGEHAAVDLRERYLLKCTQCDREFVAWSHESKQASSCAASIYDKHGERRLLGHYGSTVADMAIYRFIRNAPEPCDPVCDYCILTFIKNGDVEYVGEDHT